MVKRKSSLVERSCRWEAWVEVKCHPVKISKASSLICSEDPRIKHAIRFAAMYTATSLTLVALATTAFAACPINGASTQLIQNYEKFRANPYDDGSGFWTIGYGHRVSEPGYLGFLMLIAYLS